MYCTLRLNMIRDIQRILHDKSEIINVMGLDMRGQLCFSYISNIDNKSYDMKQT